MSIDTTNFDTELFINEVKKRPALWNTHIEEYNNDAIKQGCLEEIVDLFGGQNMTAEEQLQLSRVFKRKWRNLKDCYAREKRRVSSTKSKSAVKRKSEYKYFQHLSFLSECSAVTVTQSNVEISDSPIENSKQLKQMPYNRKRRKITKEERDKELENVTKEEEKDKWRELQFELLKDEDKMFFLSLASEFKKVPEYLKLTIKKRILDMIYEASCENYPYSTVSDSSLQ